MTLTQRALQLGRKRLARKLIRAVPYLGGVVAVVTLGSAMRRKGAVRGVVDTALDVIPFIGGVKSAAEVLRGRDFIAPRV